jgi:hypothetical protein
VAGTATPWENRSRTASGFAFPPCPDNYRNNQYFSLSSTSLSLMKEKGHRKELSEMVQETQGAMQFLHRELEGAALPTSHHFCKLLSALVK